MISKTILIAENDNSFREILSEKLQHAGYSIVLVSSGSEVVPSLLEVNPDLLLLALDLPDKEGFDIMQDIKTRDETRNLFIVVISESGDPMEIEKAREVGADDFLIRAIFDPEEVLQKINKAFNEPIDPSVHKQESSDGTKELEDILSDMEVPQSIGTEGETTDSSTKNASQVLIIEDDKFLREDLYGRKLRAAGFDVESAENGDRAFKMLSMMIPDIIILDLVLPGMDGFEILQKIREGEKTSQIPVIIVSNLGQQEDVDKAMKLGATDFMVKANFTLDEIATRISSILDKE